MRKKFILLIIIFFSVSCFNSIYAGSFYSSKGFGLRSYFSNSQAIGLGGTLIACADRYQINTLNPAGLVFIPITRLSGDFIHDAIWSESEGESGFSKYTNLNGMSLAIPLKKQKFVAAFNIASASQFDYNYEQPGQIDDYNYLKKIEADGGLNKISFGMGMALPKRIYVGAYFNYFFGKLEQTWGVDYVSDLIWDSSDKLTRKMWGFNFTGGIMFEPISNLYLGAIYSKNYNLTIQDHIKNSTIKGSTIYNVTKDKNEEKEITLPEMLGAGVSYALKNKLRISCDYIYEPWSKFKVEDILVEDFNDCHRIGAGLELLPSNNMLASYYQKMTYRVGYFHQQLNYLDNQGNTVSEYGVSFGLGFPYYQSLGRIDLALRWGQRGYASSNPVKEDVFQLFISIAGGERWFVRGERK